MQRKKRKEKKPNAPTISPHLLCSILRLDCYNPNTQPWLKQTRPSEYSERGARNCGTLLRHLKAVRAPRLQVPRWPEPFPLTPPHSLAKRHTYVIPAFHPHNSPASFERASIQRCNEADSHPTSLPSRITTRPETLIYPTGGCSLAQD